MTCSLDTLRTPDHSRYEGDGSLCCHGPNEPSPRSRYLAVASVTGLSLSPESVEADSRGPPPTDLLFLAVNG